jgi:hypothetical protein
MRLILKVVVAALALLVAVAVAYLAANRVPDRPVEVLKPRWATPPSRFIDVAGMSVHVRDEGHRDDPMPLLLLHGTGSSLHTWDGWSAQLAGSRRVVRFDMPGFGLTGPAVDGNYAIENYARVAVAVMDQLGIAMRCSLETASVGTSPGRPRSCIPDASTRWCWWIPRGIRSSRSRSRSGSGSRRCRC